MQEYEGFKKGGTFLLSSDVEVQGELRLDGETTVLNLYSDRFFDTHSSQDILGSFYDRSKVSLINCITLQGPGRGVRGGENYHFSSVFPHFVVFGDEHIRSSDRVILELSFTVDDASILFHDFDAFGSVINARPHMEKIAEEQVGGRRIDIGEHPHLFYFSGKCEILSVDTVLGKLSVRHGMSYTSPGPEGIRVDNAIRLSIAFRSAETVEDAVVGVLDVLRFLEIIAGRPQNVSELSIFPESTEEYPKALEVYWCLPPRRHSDSESRKPHPGDLPIQGAMTPDEFTYVLKRWLERNNEWRNARARFSRAFAYQNRYDIDRLVGAANMFDILPTSAYQKAITLSADLAQVSEKARREFKDLPASPERDSVLSALGRIGKPTLKRKVRSRAKLISDIVRDRLPELEMVVDQAVDCRNYYVHGSVAKIDYGERTEQIHFLTDTLEFVFAASDLIEAGWDINEWIRRGTVLSHPFGQYRVNYSHQLRELKKMIIN